MRVACVQHKPIMLLFTHRVTFLERPQQIEVIQNSYFCLNDSSARSFFSCPEQLSSFCLVKHSTAMNLPHTVVSMPLKPAYLMRQSLDKVHSPDWGVREVNRMKVLFIPPFGFINNLHSHSVQNQGPPDLSSVWCSSAG